MKEIMKAKFILLAIIVGIFLAPLTVHVSGRLLILLLDFIPTRGITYFYLKSSLSSSVLPLIVMFSLGYFVFSYKPLFFGALAGLVAVIVLSIIFARYPSTGMIIEYVTIITCSAIGCYLGRRARVGRT